tara:strand:+ start:9596 stop:10075 length:480 start_codon:yes stop_codon:yes gene_type:complete
MSAMAKHTCFCLNDFRVYVDDEVISVWENHRQIGTSDNESFGVLAGSHSHDNKTFWVELCTTPQPNDSATRTSFVMRDYFHCKFVDSSYSQSQGLIGYIGTWHTHPVGVPFPSNIDVDDWIKCTERNVDRKLFFFIVGTKETRAFMRVKDTFIYMNRRA